MSEKVGEYSIERSRFGVAVRGSVPLDELSSLTKLWLEQGLTVNAVGIASSLGATLAVCRPEMEEGWRKEVEAAADERARGDAELAWLFGTDTGTSSKTIFSVLSKKNGYMAFNGSRWGAAPPQDPDDFGRCHRLLERFPAWRPHLDKVARAHPEWAGLVERWDECERLFLEEAPSGRAPKLYALMRELLGKA